MNTQHITITQNPFLGFVVLPRTVRGREGSSYYVNVTSGDHSDALFSADTFEEVASWVKARHGALGATLQHPVLGRVRYGAVAA